MTGKTNTPASTAPTRPAARPQIPVDIGSPANCQLPVETPDAFNYRIVQRNNRARRIANGGL